MPTPSDFFEYRHGIIYMIGVKSPRHPTPPFFVQNLFSDPQTSHMGL